jgi:hypothetical protein
MSFQTVKMNIRVTTAQGLKKPHYKQWNAIQSAET